MNQEHILAILHSYLNVPSESMAMMLTCAMVVVMAGVFPSIRQIRFGWIVWAAWLGLNAYLLAGGPTADNATGGATWRGFAIMGSLAVGCVIGVLSTAYPIPKSIRAVTQEVAREDA